MEETNVGMRDLQNRLSVFLRIVDRIERRGSIPTFRAHAHALPLLPRVLIVNDFPDFGVHDPFHPDQSWAGPILGKVKLLAKFEEYHRFGTRPIFLEGPESYGAKVLQTIQKTIESDIPFLVASLKVNHLH